MSGQLHDIGSIVDFWPAAPMKRPGSEEYYATDFVGIALVVVARSTWVITTELRPVRLIDGRYVANDGSAPPKTACAGPGCAGRPTTPDDAAAARTAGGRGEHGGTRA